MRTQCPGYARAHKTLVVCSLKCRYSIRTHILLYTNVHKPYSSVRLWRMSGARLLHNTPHCCGAPRLTSVRMCVKPSRTSCGISACSPSSPALHRDNAIRTRLDVQHTKFHVPAYTSDHKSLDMWTERLWIHVKHLNQTNKRVFALSTMANVAQGITPFPEKVFQPCLTLYDDATSWRGGFSRTLCSNLRTCRSHSAYRNSYVFKQRRRDILRPAHIHLT
jgi:hypothetical protein